MKKSNRSLARVLVAAVALLAVSSCNRGYGCPTNFSIDDALLDTLQRFLSLLF